MIFARFVESERNANFTRGKIYFASEEYHYDATSIGNLSVIDDSGNRIEINQDSKEFVFPEIIYGVWVGNKLPHVEQGTVFAIDDGDNEAFHIVGDGYLMRKGFEILDSTVLHPSIVYVQDIKTGFWNKIIRVGESGLFCVEKDTELRVPTDFRFFVSDGSIAGQPIVFCKNNTGADLTVGTAYCIIHEKTGIITVKNDLGIPEEYEIDRFSKSYSNVIK